ncbi:L,D-transpeptidase [Actinomycetospora sp. TBRC 11914]|uniref:L,D-transpeptidase n=1 Tax=Actinomycetospora sp. TBRC 11914 TaxID=2729387 RepID=UPI0020071225|nr:L,D-transpeptidase [Actinomycetospora sp. TBRC 11914]
MLGSAVALVGALGVTAGLGLPGAAGSPAPRPVAATVPTTAAPAPAAPAAPAVVPAAVAAPSAAHGVTTRTAKPATRPTTSTSDSPCGITDGACVSISRKRAWLVRDGHVVYSAPITTGRPGERTEPGTFHVTWKDADHRSREFDDAPMPWSVFFDGGIAFHTGSLSRQSAGCVHLSDAAARTFFRTLHVGDTVVVQR